LVVVALVAPMLAVQGHLEQTLYSTPSQHWAAAAVGRTLTEPLEVLVVVPGLIRRPVVLQLRGHPVVPQVTGTLVVAPDMAHPLTVAVVGVVLALLALLLPLVVVEMVAMVVNTTFLVLRPTTPVAEVVEL
jgi:hypothetical protein